MARSDRHGCDASAYQLGSSGPCLHHVLHSASSCGEHIQPLLVHQHAAALPRAGTVHPGPVDHTASMAGPDERQGRQPAGAEAGSPAPAKLPACLVSSSSYFFQDLEKSSSLLFFLNQYLCFRKEKKNGLVPPRGRSSLSCALPGVHWPLQPLLASVGAAGWACS